MTRSRKLLLIATLFAVQAHAGGVQARDAGCRDIAVATPTQAIVLRNTSDRPLTLALRFSGPATPALACGLLTVPAGGDSGAHTLGSLCPNASAAPSGVLEACRAPVVVRAHRGTPTGDLLADLQANNLPTTGR